jgi:hypothetical protein
LAVCRLLRPKSADPLVSEHTAKGLAVCMVMEWTRACHTPPYTSLGRLAVCRCIRAHRQELGALHGSLHVTNDCFW